MKRRHKIIILTFVLSFVLGLIVGCGKKEEIKEETPIEVIQEEVEVVDDSIVRPMNFEIDLENINNQMLSVFFNEDSFFYGPEDQLFLELIVYDYEQFDPRDINSLEEGSKILICDEEITVETIETLATGDVMINGGFEEGGHIFHTDGTGMTHEVVENDHKVFYELGNVALPISNDLVFIDDSDLDNMGIRYSAEAFLAEEVEFGFNFWPLNTTVRIVDGEIVEINRVYIP